MKMKCQVKYLYIVGGDPLQKFNVLLAVESGHVRS